MKPYTKKDHIHGKQCFRDINMNKTKYHHQCGTQALEREPYTKVKCMVETENPTNNRSSSPGSYTDFR